MLIPPKYQISRKSIELIAQIEAGKTFFETVEIPVKVEENFRQKALLESSLFSARIEGNKLQLKDFGDVKEIRSKSKEKIEVANLMMAIRGILLKKLKNIAADDILFWHKATMKNLPSEDILGRFRNGEEGIFDRSGNLVYHAPTPSEVPKLIDKLLDYVNSDREIPIIKAIISHFIFEAIHPFVDGNGRVGRLLQLAILSQHGYAMKGLIGVEKEIENNRSLYYQNLGIDRNDATEFLESNLQFIVDAINIARNNISNKNVFSKEDELLPRRQEILYIVRDHQQVSLDFLQRRFMQVDGRVLRQDMKKLADLGLIKKVGYTKGARYEPKYG